MPSCAELRNSFTIASAAEEDMPGCTSPSTRTKASRVTRPSPSASYISNSSRSELAPFTGHATDARRSASFSSPESTPADPPPLVAESVAAPLAGITSAKNARYFT